MARCGRCGLWSQYPDDHREQKYAGVCLWYQLRLVPDQVYDDRKCSDFFERIPEVTPMEHFTYKVRRDNLGDAYTQARFSKRLSIMGAVISVTSITISLWKVFHG